MAKKKAATKPNGIYKVEKKTYSDEEFLETMKRWSEGQSVHEWIDGRLRELADIIKPHIDESGKRVAHMNLGDGWKGYRLADEISDAAVRKQVNAAIDCQNQIYVVQRHLAEDGSLSGDMCWVVSHAFMAGQLAERIGVYPFEPFVVSAKVSKSGRSKGGANTKKITDDQFLKVEKYIAKRYDDSVSVAAACVEASAQLRTGKFKGIKGRIDIAASTLRNRYNSQS